MTLNLAPLKCNEYLFSMNKPSKKIKSNMKKGKNMRVQKKYVDIYNFNCFEKSCIDDRTEFNFD